MTARMKDQHHQVLAPSRSSWCRRDLSADNWQYLYIGTRLASHGFVVAVTDHENEGQWSWSPKDERGNECSIVPGTFHLRSQSCC